MVIFVWSIPLFLRKTLPTEILPQKARSSATRDVQAKARFAAKLA